MPEDEKNIYGLAVLIILLLFAYIIIKEITKRTKIVELVRDENGRIAQIVEKTM